MLTRAGRVVVMDFGLAKARDRAAARTICGNSGLHGTGAVARGGGRRAGGRVLGGSGAGGDAGGGGEQPRAARRCGARCGRRRRGCRRVRGRRCCDRRSLPIRASRHASARALARALEEVTHRLPGLRGQASVSGPRCRSREEDAEYFFGREMEVEAVWKKLKRPRLLALIGPSGAGKSSFLRAGLLPTPADRLESRSSRHRATVPSSRWRRRWPRLSREMPRRSRRSCASRKRTPAVSLFRASRRHEHASSIVDQFEELFTLNPPEVQEAFAQLLGRLVLEADVHVILSLRDDFLFRCHGARGARCRSSPTSRRSGRSARARCGGRWSSRRSPAATASRTRRSSTRWSRR